MGEELGTVAVSHPGDTVAGPAAPPPPVPATGLLVASSARLTRLDQFGAPVGEPVQLAGAVTIAPWARDLVEAAHADQFAQEWRELVQGLRQFQVSCELAGVQWQALATVLGIGGPHWRRGKRDLVRAGAILERRDRHDAVRAARAAAPAPGRLPRHRGR